MQLQRKLDKPGQIRLIGISGNSSEIWTVHISIWAAAVARKEVGSIGCVQEISPESQVGCFRNFIPFNDGGIKITDGRVVN